MGQQPDRIDMAGLRTAFGLDPIEESLSELSMGELTAEFDSHSALEQLQLAYDFVHKNPTYKAVTNVTGRAIAKALELSPEDLAEQEISFRVFVPEKADGSLLLPTSLHESYGVYCAFPLKNGEDLGILDISRRLLSYRYAPDTASMEQVNEQIQTYQSLVDTLVLQRAILRPSSLANMIEHAAFTVKNFDSGVRLDKETHPLTRHSGEQAMLGGLDNIGRREGSAVRDKISMDKDLAILRFIQLALQMETRRKKIFYVREDLEDGNHLVLSMAPMLEHMYFADGQLRSFLSQITEDLETRVNISLSDDIEQYFGAKAASDYNEMVRLVKQRLQDCKR